MKKSKGKNDDCKKKGNGDKIAHFQIITLDSRNNNNFRDRIAQYIPLKHGWLMYPPPPIYSNG